MAKKTRIEQIYKMLGKKRLQILFLFYVLLILPLLSPLAQNIPCEKVVLIMVANIILFLAVLFLSMFLSPKGEKIIFTLLLIFAMIPGAMLLGYLLFARVLLEQNSITSLFETNTEESKEFVMYYLNIWVVVGVLLYIILPIIMIWRMKSVRPLPIRKHTVMFAVAAVIIMCIIFVSRLSQSVYFINFYNTFVTYKIRLYNENKHIPQRQYLPYEVKSQLSDDESETLVVVIGESLGKHHMQLYGYGRETNPLLSAKGDSIIVFKDVVSPQVHTIPVIRSVLSLSEREHPEYFIDKPSLFELFNRAGYETYFISNQPFGGKYQSSYDVLLNLAKNKYSLSGKDQNDGVVLSQLNDILSSSQSKHKLIVIHLIGNHMAYKFRYPQEFNTFDNNKHPFIEETSFRNKEAIRAMDEYDDSVLYNDYVISKVIDQLNADKSTKSAMVYFSDHGEELYDFRNFAGHAYEKVSTYMCEIPFIVWMSEGYKSKYNHLVIDPKRAFSTGNFLYSLSDLAGLQYSDFDSKKSLFSNKYSPDDRYVGDIKYQELADKRK